MWCSGKGYGYGYQCMVMEFNSRRSHFGRWKRFINYTVLKKIKVNKLPESFNERARGLVLNATGYEVLSRSSILVGSLIVENY